MKEPVSPGTLMVRAVDRWEAGQTDFSSFVVELEYAVNLAETEGDDRAPMLRSMWGELEIINAVSLDRKERNVELDIPEREIYEIVERIRSLVRFPALAVWAVDRWEAGQTDFSSFVVELEYAVNLAETEGDDRAPILRSLWQELDIVNAIAGGNTPDDDTGRIDLDRLVERVRVMVQ